jgi:hypothetical protein
MPIYHELNQPEQNQVDSQALAQMRNLKLHGHPAFKEIRDGIIKALGEERAMLLCNREVHKKFINY